MKKQPASLPMKRLHISAETVHILYPGLPLETLPMQDGLYDSISAFDLARELGFNKAAANSDEDTSKSRRPRAKTEVKYQSVDTLLVDGKEYFSVRITAQRTGYTSDELYQLTLLPNSSIQYVHQDLDNGQSQVLFFDVDSVKTYRPSQK
jgi:hypothetical protein